MATPGKVTNVVVEESGDELIAQVPTGSTVLPVDDAYDFSEDGGQLTLDGTLYPYVGVDYEADTVTLATPTTSDYPLGTPVRVYPPGSVKIALVEFDDDDEGCRALIPYGMAPQFPDGIRDIQDQESVLVSDSRGRWEVVAADEEIPVIQGGYIVDLPDPFVPEAAPGSSPAISATGLADSIIVTSEDPGFGNTVAYYLSTDPDFVPGPATLVLKTPSRVVVITSLPDGSPLELETEYYVQGVSENSKGTAPTPSNKVVVTLNPDLVSKLIAAQLIAGFVLAGEIKVGDITIDPVNGIVIPSPQGVTKLSADGTGNQFAGQGVFDAIDVLGNLGIYGLTNFLSGKLSINKGVTDPTSAPVVTTGYERGPFSPGFSRRGLCRNLSGNTWITTDSAGTGGNIQGWTNAGGVGYVGADLPNGNHPLGGVTRIGNVYYVLARSTNNGTWKIFKYDASTAPGGSYPYLGFSGVVLTAGVTSLPMIGKDLLGNLLMAYTNSNGLYVRRLNPTTFATIGSDHHDEYWTPSKNISSIQEVNFGTSYEYFVVSSETEHQVLQPGGGTALTRITSLEWPRATNDIDGLYHDGTKWTMMSNESGFWYYTNNSGTWDFAYSWYDSDPGGAGLAETKPSPKRTLAPTKYARWTVTLPTLPPDDGTADGANTARVYAAKTGLPLIQQSTLPEGTVAATYDEMLTSGGASSAVNGFASRLGAIGDITSIAADSNGPLITLKGDGSGKTGPLSWNEAGSITSTPVPLGTVLMTARMSADNGFLLCNGQAVSRTTYAGLFAAIGTTYGAGNGSSTFNIPDLRKRIPLGAGTNYSLGAGDSIPEADRTLAHYHTVPSHSHTVSGTTGGPDGTVNRTPRTSGSDNAAGGSHSHSFSATSSSVSLNTGSSGWMGGSDPSTNFPNISMNYQIKAL